MIIFRLTIFFLVLGLALAIEKVSSVGKNEGDGKYLYKIKWYDQKVDHFSFTNRSTFKQRYLINDTYWKKGEKR